MLVWHNYKSRWQTLTALWQFNTTRWSDGMGLLFWSHPAVVLCGTTHRFCIYGLTEKASAAVIARNADWMTDCTDQTTYRRACVRYAAMCEPAGEIWGHVVGRPLPCPHRPTDGGGDINDARRAHGPDTERGAGGPTRRARIYVTWMGNYGQVSQ